MDIRRHLQLVFGLFLVNMSHSSNLHWNIKRSVYMADHAQCQCAMNHISNIRPTVGSVVKTAHGLPGPT